ncbi:phospholipase D/nuclease [Exidia glandulosa HHB12029]|uniref:Phospholipase D/nuclease n=1 Tax=Exidia glandulosa HHB12029 TaxID=1314781 RepID=A0A165JL26_EXIGL|nr:phospholipase D/nuclease [Exidia glandulosa HHB12029]
MDDDDGALAMAIAASLEDSKRKDVIVIDSDSEPDDPDAQFQRDLDAALKASQADPARASGMTAPADTPAMSSFMLERKKLEAERLARQKRLRGEDSTTSSAREGGDDDDDADKPPPQKSSASTSSNSGLFWDGELRPTANMHVDADKATGPVFRLTEIIGDKNDLAFAVVSSYSNDIAWLMSMFPDKVPVVLVNHPMSEGGNDLHFLSTNWLLVSPAMPANRGAMHIKLLLLFYKSGRLRVVIPTANLLQMDWRDIENYVWVQDIPKLMSPTPFAKLPKDNFAAILTDTLKILNVGHALTSFQKTGQWPGMPIHALDELRMWWDWSRVTAKLVPSFVGRHEGWPNVVRVGHTALLKSLRDMGADCPPHMKLTLECQGSSIGRYSTQWMNEFYCSARGEPSEKFTWIGNKSLREKLPYPPIKILFPSLRTVDNSVLGRIGGGTMFCDPDMWRAPKFPRDNFYDSNSKRGRVLMHTKMILGIFEHDSNFNVKGKRKGDPYDTDDDDDDEVQIVGETPKKKKREKLAGWLYVGSHNFTPSAWGTLSGSRITPVLNITNFELGVVLPIKEPEQLDEMVAWKRPARKYNLPQDVPWMQKTHLPT